MEHTYAHACAPWAQTAHGAHPNITHIRTCLRALGSNGTRSPPLWSTPMHMPARPGLKRHTEPTFMEHGVILRAAQRVQRAAGHRRR